MCIPHFDIIIVQRSIIVQVLNCGTIIIYYETYCNKGICFCTHISNLVDI